MPQVDFKTAFDGLQNPTDLNTIRINLLHRAEKARDCCFDSSKRNDSKACEKFINDLLGYQPPGRLQAGGDLITRNNTYKTKYDALSTDVSKCSSGLSELQDALTKAQRDYGRNKDLLDQLYNQVSGAARFDPKTFFQTNAAARVFLKSMRESSNEIQSITSKLNSLKTVLDGLPSRLEALRVEGSGILSDESYVYKTLSDMEKACCCKQEGDQITSQTSEKVAGIDEVPVKDKDGSGSIEVTITEIPTSSTSVPTTGASEEVPGTTETDPSTGSETVDVPEDPASADLPCCPTNCKPCN